MVEKEEEVNGTDKHEPKEDEEETEEVEASHDAEATDEEKEESTVANDTEDPDTPPSPAPQDQGNETPPKSDDRAALLARQALLEARAINEATASADSAYVPSPALLAESSPQPLLQQVDGPSLKNYTGAPNVYQAKDIPLAVRAKLEVPIYITSGGSVVEFTVESSGYDVAFGVTAEREDKETVVKAVERVDAHIKPCNGKFLVGTVPCVLIFTFDNEYSWFTEKVVSYKITVLPPSKENILTGRRRRAKSALKSVQEDHAQLSNQLNVATKQRETLTSNIAELEKRLQEEKESLVMVNKEEEYLKTRVDLRTTQRDMLQSRVDNGWEDEKEEEKAVSEEEQVVSEE